MKILFAHGWGFDHRFWEPLAALLPEHEHQFDDRGYFGEGHAPAIEGPCLAVTHSFGTMRVLYDPPPGLTGIIAFNGFDRFSARTGRAGIPVRVIDRMLRRFTEHPEDVLTEFRRSCGNEAPFGTVFPDPLREDLLRLRDGECPSPHVPLTSVQGRQDPLLPREMRDSVFPRGSVKRVGHSAGHLLPIEDPAFCAEAVNAMIGALGALVE